MSQTLVETSCPICGAKNRLACYGVVAHRQGVTVRYFLCRKCGARVSKKYHDKPKDNSLLLLIHPEAQSEFRPVNACRPRGASVISAPQKRKMALEV